MRSLLTVSLVGLVACGHARDESPVPAGLALDIQNRPASAALLALGVATHDVVSIDSDASALAECARVTLVVPTPHPPAELASMLGDALRPAGLRLERSGGHVRMQRIPGVPPPAGCPPEVARRPAPFPPGDLFPPPPPIAPAIPDPDAAAILDGVHRVDDEHYTLTADAAHSLASSQGLLMRSARVVPHVQDGVADGLSLYGIRRGGVMDGLGLMNGDVVTSVAGRTLRGPDDALEAYALLRGRSDVDVEIRRRGVPLTLHYHVADH